MYEIVCLNCSIIKKSKHKESKYCSNKCQLDWQYRLYIDRWKTGLENGVTGSLTSGHIKRYLREKYNDACTRCGWNEKHPDDGIVPLEIEHKDGNHTNNKEENLDLICPNCHSLTSTYRGRNRNKSTRTKRVGGAGHRIRTCDVLADTAYKTVAFDHSAKPAKETI